MCASCRLSSSGGVALHTPLVEATKSSALAPDFPCTSTNRWLYLRRLKHEGAIKMCDTQTKKNNDVTICVINPGSTSTKIALFHGEKKIALVNVQHPPRELRRFRELWDQFPMRLQAVQSFLAKQKIEKLDAVVGRGGLLKPVSRGVYKVNETMVRDARKGVQGVHPSNLGPALAQEIARERHCPAFIVDPVSVDEFEPLARYSGHPLIERRTLSHALSLRAVAIWAADKMGLCIEKSRFVVAHLGGGISVAAVKFGRIIDVNDASSAGPFSPERSGSLPLQQFTDLCFSGKYTKKEIKKMIMGEGGLKAYLGETDVVAIEKRIDAGDQKAGEVFEAMIYQIAKEIGAMATVLFGRVDGIVLTGGLSHSKRLVQGLKKRASFIAPVHIFPGELEMEAMAAGALRVVRGQEKVRVYR